MLFGIELFFGESLFFFGDENLLRSKVLKNLVLDLQNVHTKNLVKWWSEILTQIIEGVENWLLRVDQYKILL